MRYRTCREPSRNRSQSTYRNVTRFVFSRFSRAWHVLRHRLLASRKRPVPHSIRWPRLSHRLSGSVPEVSPPRYEPLDRFDAPSFASRLVALLSPRSAPKQDLVVKGLIAIGSLSEGESCDAKETVSTRSTLTIVRDVPVSRLLSIAGRRFQFRSCPRVQLVACLDG
jgi:hypothetical protein